MESLSEELLAVWLQLSGAVNNQRLVTGLSFHQAQVCGLLVQAREEGRTVTAKELCRRTRILKSQMNAILCSLERLGYLQRRADPRDRRQAELLLLPAGLDAYRASHRRTLELVNRLVAAMGREQVQTMIPLLRRTVDTFDSILAAQGASSPLPGGDTQQEV